MDANRDVCMKCRTAHSAPGICPDCGYPDLLDASIPSERELLDDSSRRIRWRVVALLLFFVVLMGIVPFGTSWLAQHWLGLGDGYAALFALAAPCVLFLGTLVWLTIRQPAFPDSVKTSEHESAQWQALLDEPVPCSEEESAQMARRRAARRAQRRKL